MSRVLATFVRTNRRLSKAVNRILPENLTVDGNRTFLKDIIPRLVQKNLTIYDVGGGSQPCVSVEQKEAYGIKLTGIDISSEEMDLAPAGSYDSKIVIDIAKYRGSGDADVVVCQSVLEHLRDNRSAISAIASMIKPGGQVYIFVPCRNAVYARINRILPQAFKEKLLSQIFPGAEEHQGFPAYYDRCTPKQLAKLLNDNGIQVTQIRCFWMSSYFTIFVPAYILWRIWQGVAYMISGDEAAETFILVGRKRVQR